MEKKSKPTPTTYTKPKYSLYKLSSLGLPFSPQPFLPSPLFDPLVSIDLRCKIRYSDVYLPLVVRTIAMSTAVPVFRDMTICTTLARSLPTNPVRSPRASPFRLSTTSVTFVTF